MYLFWLFGQGFWPIPDGNDTEVVDFMIKSEVARPDNLIETRGRILRKSVTRILNNNFKALGIGFISAYQVGDLDIGLKCQRLCPSSSEELVKEKAKSMSWLSSLDARVFSLFLTCCLITGWQSMSLLYLKTILIRRRTGRVENSTMGSSHLNALQVALSSIRSYC